MTSAPHYPGSLTSPLRHPLPGQIGPGRLEAPLNQGPVCGVGAGAGQSTLFVYPSVPVFLAILPLPAPSTVGNLGEVEAALLTG